MNGFQEGLGSLRAQLFPIVPLSHSVRSLVCKGEIPIVQLFPPPRKEPTSLSFAVSGVNLPVLGWQNSESPNMSRSPFGNEAKFHGS